MGAKGEVLPSPSVYIQQHKDSFLRFVSMESQAETGGLVLMWPFIFSTIVFALALVHYVLKKGPKNTPPEAKGWPILGYVPYLYPRSYKGLMELKKDHPDIVTISIGYTKFILLLSHQAFKEAFITKGENFSGRPFNQIRDRVTQKSGILMIDGPIWKEHRRFSLRVLRDFGFGRNLSEEIVYAEVQNLVNFINKKQLTETSGINTLDLLLRSVSNVICTLTMGEQPGYEDDLFSDIVNRIRTNLQDTAFKSIFTMFPWLMNLGFLIKLIPRTKRNLANVAITNEYISSKIKKHVDVFDPTAEPRDYIDAFLLEQHKLNQRKTSAEESHSYTSIQLLREIVELFIAGSDTTSNSLAWGILLVAIHKDVQKKCHEEIDSQIGRDRFPNMKDKQSTPYILAILDEVQRFTTLVPMALVHRNFQEDNIMGYTIPAESKIVPFIYAVHHDPKVWEKPNEFYPQHFLSKDGQTYVPREELVPFGMGKRSCLGESLARIELYIFFVSLLQRYTVSLSTADQHRLDEIFLGTEGIILSPADHKIVFETRK